MTKTTTQEIQKAIKSKIKGVVHCNIVENMLIIDIYSINHTVFRYTRNNMSSEIVQEETAETIAEYVFKQYKNYINNLFFI